ncbi:restriction endonuclease subunit S [Fibrobacter sp. UWH9]|uniref:restriction endonuclease subunit S n=1 Tax=Fibrobacter sp. UWH9 TaxID=1896213 RepID=UPI0009FAF2BC|nr:restriction endonuclease subunit S [Fibrobacter sp. UWH9]
MAASSECHPERSAAKSKDPAKKKQTAEPKQIIPIDKSEAPFEIPSTWEWVKLGDICQNIKRGKSPKYTESDSSTLIFAQKCNQKNGPVSLEKALYLDESTLEKYPQEEFMQYGDTVINSTGTGTLGRVGYFNASLPDGVTGIVPDSHVTTVRPILCNTQYVYYVVKCNQEYLEGQGEGSTNQKELKPHTIFYLPVPLPPLAEQQRIVATIEQAFAEFDAMESNL